MFVTHIYTLLKLIRKFLLYKIFLNKIDFCLQIEDCTKENDDMIFVFALITVHRSNLNTLRKRKKEKSIQLYGLYSFPTKHV